MYTGRFFLPFLLSAVLVGGLDLLGVFFDLYWKYWWFDIPLHMLGGFFVAFCAFAFASYAKKSFTSHELLLFLVLTVLVVGVLWEVFEFTTDLVLRENPYYLFDTVKDILDDSIGAVLAWLLLRLHHGTMDRSAEAFGTLDISAYNE